MSSEKPFAYPEFDENGVQTLSQAHGRWSDALMDAYRIEDAALQGAEGFSTPDPAA